MTTPSTRGWLHDARKRRLLYLALAAVAAVLIVFPRPHTARARLLPQEMGAGTAGILGPAIGSAQHVGSLLAGQPAIERDLVLARNQAPKADAIRALGLVGPSRRFGSLVEAMGWLDARTDVHPLPGGVIEVEAVLGDGDTALRLTAAYADAIARHLTRATGAPVRIADPATLLPKRPYNVRAVAGLALVLLLALFTEWYAPATGLFPPARRSGRAQEFA